MKVIITGASGMVGRGVLLECLEDKRIENILIINRKPLGIKAGKLKEVILEDFSKIEKIRDAFNGYNGCFFCLGVSSVGMDESKYSAITFDLTINFAKIFLSQNPKSIFCYVSGAGTSEKSNTMWSRIKGKTENHLMAMDFKSAFMYRPGYIHPMKGIQSKTKIYNLLYKVFWPIYHLLKYIPGAATNTSNFGKAMINSLYLDQESGIFTNKEINELAN